MSSVTLGEIADYLEAEFAGPRDEIVSGVAPITDAGPGELTFLANEKFASLLDQSRAGAILVSDAAAGDGARWIRTRNPYLAFTQVVERWFAPIPHPRGVSPLASVDATATIGPGVAIGPFASIGANVTLDENTIVHDGVRIGAGTTVGRDCILYPNVVIYHGVTIGDRCIIQGAAIIGGDGYGFVTDGGKHHKIPQIGSVVLEDDVEIGAGCAVDRGTIGNTVIGEGTKIDNLVQIAHNCRIGRHCLIVAQAGIAGSTELGDYVIVAGQAGVAGHLKVGSRAIITAQSAALEDVPPDTKVIGFPATPVRTWMRREMMIKRIASLSERLNKIESRLNEV